jgi:hypothetical protein
VTSAAIDPASALTLKRFLMRVGLLAAFAALLSRQPGATFVGMIDLAAVITGVCAVVAKNPIGRGPLNQWDEAVALLGVRCLVVVGVGLF